jgi:hypothetical protein
LGTKKKGGQKLSTNLNPLIELGSTDVVFPYFLKKYKELIDKVLSKGVHEKYKKLIDERKNMTLCLI